MPIPPSTLRAIDISVYSEKCSESLSDIPCDCPESLPHFGRALSEVTAPLFRDDQCVNSALYNCESDELERRFPDLSEQAIAKLRAIATAIFNCFKEIQQYEEPAKHSGLQNLVRGQISAKVEELDRLSDQQARELARERLFFNQQKIDEREQFQQRVARVSRSHHQIRAIALPELLRRELRDQGDDPQDHLEVKLEVYHELILPYLAQYPDRNPIALGSAIWTDRHIGLFNAQNNATLMEYCDCELLDVDEIAEALLKSSKLGRILPRMDRKLGEQSFMRQVVQICGSYLKFAHQSLRDCDEFVFNCLFHSENIALGLRYASSRVRSNPNLVISLSKKVQRNLFYDIDPTLAKSREFCLEYCGLFGDTLNLVDSKFRAQTEFLQASFADPIFLDNSLDGYARAIDAKILSRRDLSESLVLSAFARLCQVYQHISSQFLRGKAISGFSRLIAREQSVAKKCERSPLWINFVFQFRISQINAQIVADVDYKLNSLK